MAGADDRLAILSIHPGAGGAESQDWAKMLMHMYLRWCERAGFKAEIVDPPSSAEAHIVSVTIAVTGDDAYAALRGETGVHRLVRLSPFDGRRHTSFAAVSVAPAFDSPSRSYTFHPYQGVLDHRTDIEIDNVEAVMDGDLGAFIKTRSS